MLTALFPPNYVLVLFLKIYLAINILQRDSDVVTQLSVFVTKDV